MTERRHSWKQNISQAAQKRNAKKTALILKLDCIREQIRTTRLDWKAYDELKQQQRETIAELATL